MMLKNLLTNSLRSLFKNKIFSLINISGLAVGLTASLLIMLWIMDELSYDRFHKKGKDIYRVEEDQFYSGRRYHVTVTPYPSGPVWKEKIPEITDQTRLVRLMRMLLEKGDQVYYEPLLVAADSGLFRIFTFPFIYGDPVAALRDPNSIVLTEKLSQKYFGKSNPVGQTITMENRSQLTVTGVIRNNPRNSVFSFEGVVPYSFAQKSGLTGTSWGNNSILTFVLLEKGADIPAVNEKLTNVVKEFLPQTTTKYLLFPFLDIHLHGQFGYEENNGPMIAIYVFSLIAVFIIIIACINFINLSTARASARAKEIGVRKVTGAGRNVLISQFMTESLMLVIFAMIISFFLVGLSLGVFSNITGKQFRLSDLFHIKFIIGFLATGIVTALISGFYPALFLSALKPVSIIQGESFSGRGSKRFRKALVVLQFSMSILIAVAAVFMFLQLRYLRNKDLGFEKQNLISIQLAQRLRGKYYALKEGLEGESLIRGVTASLQHPVMIGSNSGGANWDGKDPEQRVLIGMNGIDYDYTATMKMSLVSGRDFSRDFPGDLARDTTGNFLINEEVSKIMNVGDPVGKNFSFMELEGKIVGVMKNFHFKGADQPIEPIVFALADTSYIRYALIRLTEGKTSESLKIVEKVWKDVIPDFPLDYTFVDEDYENLFRAESRLTELLKYFTILAIIIGCLGLYGLSAYNTERRTNEIGIRKVMGAGEREVVAEIAREFLVLIIISLAIAIPVGWILVGKLLDQFPYRIDISIPVMLMITGAAILIAFISVSFQALKATRINPAEALRIEK